MIPWDFGIINALKKCLGTIIFPSDPPEEESLQTPYLIFELKKITHGKNLISRAEFTLTVADEDKTDGGRFAVMKAVDRIAEDELTLSAGDAVIGSAKIKMISFDSKKNKLILNFAAILKLEATYDDEDK
ncbi:MAG: hypothetical protein LBO73_04855 [Holosporaceae bacterium]|jgi:hypothetical protein|nr:hypothetical protein [Holosporaceae bacterium]